MLRRDGGDRAPWPTEKGGPTLMRHKTKAIIRAAGRRDELSFRSFRHSGFTESRRGPYRRGDQGAGTP